MFSAIKNTLKKSHAAVVIELLLEHQAKVGFFDGNPAKSANKLVKLCWDSSPEIYDGRYGQRPHKTMLAAAALAHAIRLLGKDSNNREVLAVVLGILLRETGSNWHLFPFNSLDERLYQIAETALVDHYRKSEEQGAFDLADQISDYKSFGTFNCWFERYKEVAAQVNAQLAPDENGLCLIDLMDDEPLKRAFRDGVDPDFLARKFASEFDIMMFSLSSAERDLAK